MNDDAYLEGATMDETRSSLKELAFRESDGVQVTLFWDARNDELTVSVSDTKKGDYFALGAPRESALDVFYHPYAHASAHPAPHTSLPLAA